MGIKKLKIIGILMSSILCVTFLGACSLENNTVEGTGEFSLEDLNGNTYTESMFKDYDLTVVNVFTTWCPPSVEELPYLEQISQAMKDQGVRVMGVVLDTVDESGNSDQAAVEKAQSLAEQAGVNFPLLIPDDSYINGMLEDVDAVPHTFFVDKEGRMIGDMEGAADLEDWTSVIEEYLDE